MKIIKPKIVVTVDVFYYMPDYSSLVQEFLWQTDDYWPEIPRVHKFLNYWNNNIDAIINNVYIWRERE